MARILNTLPTRMTLALLLIHAVLLPALFFGLFEVARKSQEDAFIDQSRLYARMFADIFHRNGKLDAEEEIISHLDSARLGWKSVYAVLQTDDRIVTSSLMNPDDVNRFAEDFAFGEHNDEIYYLSIPLELDDAVAVLKLGFDEEPTLLQIAGFRQTLIYILLGYLVVSLLLVVLLSKLLARPLRSLGRDSRTVASGEYGKQLAVNSDIHEIRELAHDLETMRSNLVGVNALLKQEIADRETAEAAQRDLEARLRHAQRLESIGTLAGGIAHEINNILLPLQLYTDIALEDLPADSSVRPNLDRVMKLAGRAKGLSRQILTFGRQAADREQRAQDIVPIVEESLTMVRTLVPATIDIRVNVEDNLDQIVCDSTQIQQLVVNLCNNAFRSASRTNGYIQVNLNKCEVQEHFARIHPNLHAGHYIRLEVVDTGEGMQPDTVERIFEPFFTTEAVGQGTGLGLSVVHGIVADHGGDIIVSSTPGKGSTFQVYFPTA